SKRVPRFDFQKSAICCRFLKVRRENTHTGCFLAQDDTREIWLLPLIPQPFEGFLLFSQLFFREKRCAEW
ncbi:MAG: hypothetical protein IIX86_05855, partial [Clostridia bacterium]|nr:hypothetical protein [Clostridia bacterium]